MLQVACLIFPLIGLPVQALAQDAEAAEVDVASTQPAEGETTAEAEVTAEGVLARYVEVRGGAEMIQKLRNRRHVGTMEVSGTPIPIKGEVELIVALPHQIKVSSDLGRLGQIRQVYTETAGWSIEPFAGTQLMPADERDAAIAGLNVEALADPASQYTSLELVGTEDAGRDEKPAHHLKLTDRAGRVVEQWYDVETGLLCQQLNRFDTPVGPAAEQTLFADWEPASSSDGAVTLPYPKVLEKQTADGRRVVMTFDEVELNVDLPEDTFAVPEKVQKLLERRQ